jgi:hypothetical protein
MLNFELETIHDYEYTIAEATFGRLNPEGKE